MAKESFVLVSLKEDQSKKLAQVISNDSCRKILDYLAEKEATESEIAEKLDIPISTVHYNLQQLQKGGLVTADEYHYSPKGKEVLHYKLANKYIIITPKSTWGIKEKLKSILPVGLIALGTAAIIQLFTGTFSRGMFAAQTGAREMDKSFAEEAAVMAAEAPVAQIAEPVSIATQGTFALWFLYGALFAIALYLVWDFIRYKLKK